MLIACMQELELIGSAIKAYKAALALDPKSSASLQDLAVARYQRAVALRAQAAKGAALGDEAQAELAQAEVRCRRTAVCDVHSHCP